MSKVVYRAGIPKRKRYEIQYKDTFSQSWYTTKSTFRTEFFAKMDAREWASLGYEARVVDTQASED